MKRFASEFDFVRFPLSIEIPFANFGALPAARANALALGRNLACAVEKEWRVKD